MSTPTEQHRSVNKKVLVGLAVCYLAYLTYKFFTTGLSFTNYNWWNVSEWLINYEGGFVRRGIIGQLLFWLYELHPYPVRDAIFVIAGVAFITFIYCLIRLFNKEGWSHLLLFTPCLLAVTFSAIGIFWTRRDNIALLVTWLIFILWARYARKGNLWSIVAAQLLSVLTLFIHEASFFFTFPLLALYCYSVFAKCLSPLRALAKTFFAMLPATITMAVMCIFKGDAQMAADVWASWRPMMERYPTGGNINEIGDGVKALGWNTRETFAMHLGRNWNITSFPIRIIQFAALYYLVTRINTLDLGWNKLKPVNRIRMSNYMLLQFIFLLPMFTVLSCDVQRVWCYWVFTSLIAYHCFGDARLPFFRLLSKFSDKVQRGMDRWKFLSSPYTYLAAMALTLPGVWRHISTIAQQTLNSL